MVYYLITKEVMKSAIISKMVDFRTKCLGPKMLITFIKKYVYTKVSIIQNPINRIENVMKI